MLAPYVDGSLEPSDRSAVDAHLRTCAPCRHEVAAASAARRTVLSMPTPQGPDLSAAFTPERIRKRQPSTQVRWSRLTPVLAAAAVVALVALVVPRLGGSSDDAVTAAGDSAAGAGPALRLQIETTDYDEEALGAIAEASAAAPLPAAEAGGAVSGDAAADAPAASEARFAGPERTDRAVACLERAFPGFPGELVEVKQARFEGTPAFIGHVLESPGGGAAPETLTIWVADASDCSILSVISARI
jgi:anti-sigma factor RsiW